MSDQELIKTYADCIKNLRDRKIIRTKNVLGDLGEYLAIDYYCNNPKLPNLLKTEIGTENIDAISRKGERYSIKSTSNNTTGVFYGLNAVNDPLSNKKVFEYVIICRFSDECELESIYQINWETFIRYKKWHKRMNAWYLTLSKKLIEESTVIFDKKPKIKINETKGITQ